MPDEAKQVTGNWFHEIDPVAQERFWDKVARGERSHCWDWTRSVTTSGYGQFMIRPGLIQRAHRIAWALHNGRSPNQSVVRHTCDRPICCNPDHLSLGTQADNVADTVARGRNFVIPPRRGEMHGRHKVSESDVVEIRLRRSAGETLREISTRYGIGFSQIVRICSGESWGHVVSPIDDLPASHLAALKTKEK